MEQPMLSIVVPCYNEEQRLPRFRDDYSQFLKINRDQLKTYYSSVELILIDDGSRDSTPILLRDFKVDDVEGLVHSWRHYRLEKNSGKGAAVQRGILESRGDQILISDVDLSTPLFDLFRLLESKADVAIGSRAVPGSEIIKKQNGLRPLLGQAFNQFVQLLTGIPFHDTQCGFKLVPGEYSRRVAPSMTEMRFAFDVELLLLLHRFDISFAEVPVRWTHQEPSRVSPIKDGLRMLWKTMGFTLRLGRWKQREMRSWAHSSSNLNQKI
jgi:dolichyl-phosphate beta-glucosyltransferase